MALYLRVMCLISSTLCSNACSETRERDCLDVQTQLPINLAFVVSFFWLLKLLLPHPASHSSKSWRVLGTLSSPSFDRSKALSFECHCKHEPTTLSAVKAHMEVQGTKVCYKPSFHLAHVYDPHASSAATGFVSSFFFMHAYLHELLLITQTTHTASFLTLSPTQAPSLMTPTVAARLSRAAYTLGHSKFAAMKFRVAVRKEVLELMAAMLQRLVVIKTAEVEAQKLLPVCVEQSKAPGRPRKKRVAVKRKASVARKIGGLSLMWG